MAKVTSVTASASAKINLGNYESRDVFVSFGLELDAGDSWEEVQASAFAMARMSVAAQEHFIRGGANPEPPQSLIDMVIATQLKLTNGEEIMPIRKVKEAKRRTQWKRFAKFVKGSPKGTSTRGFFGGDDLDYFRMKWDDGNEVTQDEFVALYGDKPQVFKGMFLSDDADEVFSCWNEIWNRAGDCTHRCDGYEVVSPRVQRGEPCQFREDGDPIVKGKDYKGCKQVGRLFVWPYETTTGGIGQIMIETGAINDIYTITNQLEDIEKFAGRLTGVPLLIERKPRFIPMQVGPDQEKWMISVEIDYEAYLAQQDTSDDADTDTPPPNVDPDTGEIMGDAPDTPDPWWGNERPARPTPPTERPWPGQATRELLRYSAWRKDVVTPDEIADRAASEKLLNDGLSSHLELGSRAVLLQYLFPEVNELADSMLDVVSAWLTSEKTQIIEVTNAVAQWWLTEHRELCDTEEPGRALVAANAFADNGRSIDDVPAPTDEFDQDDIPF